MNIRAALARLIPSNTQQRTANTTAGQDTTTRRTEPGDQIEQRQAWRPTARSAYGRHVQAAEHRQAAIEAIHERGRERGIDSRDVLAAMDHLDTGLRAHGWHPDQFAYGDDEDPIDDFVTGVDIDYDPRMAAYDARMAQRRPEDGDEA